MRNPRPRVDPPFLDQLDDPREIVRQGVSSAEQRSFALVKDRVAELHFVGGNADFPHDSGFALKHWVKVRYDNNAAENGIQIHGNIAITMGNVYLTNSAGDEVMVDKTFVFRKCKDGKLRLCVHKSALPFDPAK